MIEIKQDRPKSVADLGTDALALMINVYKQRDVNHLPTRLGDCLG